MKNFKLILATVFSLILTMLGYLFVLYYLQNEFSIISFVVGLMGFMISFSPAYEKWKEFFKENL